MIWHLFMGHVGALLLLVNGELLYSNRETFKPCGWAFQFLLAASFGLWVLLLPASFCVCMYVNHELVHAITHHPSGLGSNTFYQIQIQIQIYFFRSFKYKYKYKYIGKNLIKYKYKYKYSPSNTNTNTNTHWGRDKIFAILQMTY